MLTTYSMACKKKKKMRRLDNGESNYPTSSPMENFLEPAPILRTPITTTYDKQLVA